MLKYLIECCKPSNILKISIKAPRFSNLQLNMGTVCCAQSSNSQILYSDDEYTRATSSTNKTTSTISSKSKLQCSRKRRVRVGKIPNLKNQGPKETHRKAIQSKDVDRYILEALLQ